MPPSKSIFFSANRAFAITHSRMELLQKFIDLNYDLVVLVPHSSLVSHLQSSHISHLNFPLVRHPFSPLTDLLCFFICYKALLLRRPAALILYHIKPIFFHSLATLFVPFYKPVIFANITGLGHAFISKNLLTYISLLVYKFAFGRCTCVFFQNPDDLNLFISHKLLPSHKAVLVNGVGVPLDQFPYVSRDRTYVHNHSRPITVLMVGRLIRPKGIYDFLHVASLCLLDFPDVKFIWLGEHEPAHPDSADPAEFFDFPNTSFVPFTSNVTEYYNNSDILLFTSYREGSPRTIMEAASTGLPAVAYDVPGVRSTIQHSITGLLSEPLNPDALYCQLKGLIVDPITRLNYGRNASIHASSCFDRSANTSYLSSLMTQYLQS